MKTCKRCDGYKVIDRYSTWEGSCPDCKMETGTLKELDVKQGDVVAWYKAENGYEWQDDNFSGVCDWVINEFGHAYSKYVDDTFDAKCNHKFRIVSRASDTPTLWRDMTDAEKGALLLAHHEGKSIEKNNIRDGWISCQGQFCCDVAYRIKPEPKIDTVVLYGEDMTSTWGPEKQPFDTYRITLTYRDGKVDPVAQVEKL